MGTQAKSPKVIKWESWLKRLEHQLISLHHHRRLWQDMMDALATQSCGDTVFADHYTVLFVDGASVAVRRIAEVSNDPRTASLGNLIKDVRDSPEAITRDEFVKRYESDDDREWARRSWIDEGARQWDTLFGNALGQLDIERIDGHLADIAATVYKITAFADRTLAHLDRRGVKDMPTFADLDASIDNLGKHFKHYSVYISGAGWATLEPAVQSDWRRPFRSALFEPIQGRWSGNSPPDVLEERP